MNLLNVRRDLFAGIQDIDTADTHVLLCAVKRVSLTDVSWIGGACQLDWRGWSTHASQPDRTSSKLMFLDAELLLSTALDIFSS
jgi:hypothetical protein